MSQEFVLDTPHAGIDKRSFIVQLLQRKPNGQRLWTFIVSVDEISSGQNCMTAMMPACCMRGTQQGVSASAKFCHFVVAGLHQCTQPWIHNACSQQRRTPQIGQAGMLLADLGVS